MTPPPTTTVGDARRMGAAAIKDAGRARALGALSSGGARVAKLDRGAVPHWMIVKALGRAIPRRFDPDAAGDLNATFELRVRNPRGREPARFALRIADGSVTVTGGPAADAGACATVGADDLILMVSGAIGWPALLSNGRLELRGDPFLALRFPSLFRLPARAS
jgi:SCP-2 sterol transfer family